MNEADYDKIWNQIKKSPFSGLYLSELHWLADSIAQRTQKLFDNTPNPGSGSYIKVNPQQHSEIFAILSDATKIRTFIKNRARSSSQSELIYEIQSLRLSQVKITN